MINSNVISSTSNNPKTITFPKDSNILATTETSHKLADVLKTGIRELPFPLFNFIAPVKNIKAALEITKYYLDNLPITKDYDILKRDIMTELLSNYKYEEIADNKLLKKYKIKKLPENNFEYKIDGIPYKLIKYIEEKSTPKSDLYESKFSKMLGMYCGIHASIKNEHTKIAEELIIETLKTADLNLSLFLACNHPRYNESTVIISNIIGLLEPKTRIYTFKTLEKHWHKNWEALLSFSSILYRQECFDQIIELLETKLESTDTDNTAPDNTNIGSCYYNLGLAYYNKMNYQSAKKYHLKALNYLPNYQDAILELSKIHSKFNEVKKAKYYINSLESKDIKNLLEMGFDLPTVTTAKLKSINKSVIPLSLHPLIENLECIKKFNEGRFFNDDKIKFRKLTNSCTDNELLFSTALYTQQLDIAKEIIQRIPKEELSQNKYFWQFKFLLGIEADNENLQVIIKNNNLQGAEAADAVNILNTVLIADGNSTSVTENIENTLKYDCNNETTLEIGIAAALLNNNKEKAKEYANQLNEEKQQEISANYSKDNKAENIEQLIEQYDAKEIHAYYQQIKKQKISEISKKITNSNIISKWNIEKQNITTKDVTFVGKYKGLNCFAKVKEEVKKKLGNNLIDSFTRAIEKGITYCKTNINGIKFLQNKAVEVKIDGDMRLFTHIIYKNSQEELLIDFDHYGNHSNVENFANDHKLEILGNLEIL